MSEPFRVLVVDDEAPARRKVKRLLSEDPRFLLCGEASGGLEALEKVRTLTPDLLVLGIQMPGLTGFEVLESLDVPRPQVLFATAYDTFALAAFQAGAVDYLLKPYEAERFHQALDRAATLLRANVGWAPVGLLDLLRSKPLERLVVREQQRWAAIPLDAVSRIQADGKFVRIHALGGVHPLRRSLAELETRLDPRRFVRVHRGEIVALGAVAHLEPWDHGDGLLILQDGTHVVLSRTFRTTFLERWGFS